MNALRGFGPSPAMMIACAALLVALGGTSYDATQRLPKNSVTSYQVKDFSLLLRDFRRGQVPQGPAGQAGPAGPTGPAGPAGPSGSANIKWALVRADGTIVAQSGRIQVQFHSTGTYIVDFNSNELNGKLVF